MYPRVTAHNTPPLWARGRAGPARFGPGVGACRLSRYGGWAGPGGSTRPHPESPRPSRDAPTPARSGDRATFFSRVVRIRTRDPVFGPLPIGPQPLQGPADGFITQTGARSRLAHGTPGRPGRASRPPWACHRCAATDAEYAGDGHSWRRPAWARQSWDVSIASPSLPRPVVLKAWMTLRTVWTQQPTSCAMGFGDSPRALARTIWARRTRKASAVRRSASNCLRSSPMVLQHTRLRRNTGLLWSRATATVLQTWGSPCLT